MYCHDGFMTFDSSINEASHDLVALGIKTTIDPRLWNAICQLTPTKILIRCDSDWKWSHDFCVRWCFPIDMKLPVKDFIVFQNSFQLSSACSHHEVGRAVRWQPVTINVSVVKKVHAVDDETLFCCGQPFEHLVSLNYTRMFLNDVVTGAGWVVITIRPNCRPWVVREERSKKFVPVVLAQRIGGSTNCVTHGVRPIASG